MWARIPALVPKVRMSIFASGEYARSARNAGSIITMLPMPWSLITRIRPTPALGDEAWDEAAHVGHTHQGIAKVGVDPACQTRFEIKL